MDLDGILWSHYLLLLRYYGLTGTLGALLAYPHRLIFEAGHSDVKLSQVIQDTDWRWPAARSEEMVELHTLLCDMRPNLEQDRDFWTPSSSGLFHVGATWQKIRHLHAKIHWYSLVWFAGIIPKHAFISWLAVHDRLSTRVR